MAAIDRGVALDRQGPDYVITSLAQRAPITVESGTMDHLDALESQSIYIFREAFNRLNNIAMLWSLGKDSNVMVWLARKAFFGHIPFPAVHIDTGKKFQEMYEFRDRYVEEWGLNFISGDCPPVEDMDT